MIALSHVTCLVRDGQNSVPVLEDVSVLFGAGERIGILAPPGSGKTTIARLLSGIEPPDSGDIQIDGRVSWPLGFAGFLHPELTGEMNIALTARIIGEDPMEMLNFCTELNRQQDGYRNKMKDYSPSIRAALSFALSLARPCDFYIADEKISVGDGEDRDRLTDMLEYRLEGAGLAFLSRTPRYLETFCSRFFVLRSAQLIEVDSAATAEAVLKLADDDAV